MWTIIGVIVLWELVKPKNVKIKLNFDVKLKKKSDEE